MSFVKHLSKLIIQTCGNSDDSYIRSRTGAIDIRWTRSIDCSDTDRTEAVWQKSSSQIAISYYVD